SPARVEEHLRPASGEGRPDPDQVRVEGRDGVTAEGYQPGAAALAVQQDGAGRQVEVVDAGADRLGDARAGPVQEFQQGLVAQGERLVPAGRAEDRLDLV